MPMLALFRWQGDADALVAAYDREMNDAPVVTLDQPRRPCMCSPRARTERWSSIYGRATRTSAECSTPRSSNKTSRRRVG